MPIDTPQGRRAGAENHRPVVSPASGPKAGGSATTPRLESRAVSTRRFPVSDSSGEIDCFTQIGRCDERPSTSMAAAPVPHSLTYSVWAVMAASVADALMRSTGFVETRAMRTKLVTTSSCHSLGRRFIGMRTLTRPVVVPCSAFHEAMARWRPAMRTSFTVPGWSMSESRRAPSAESDRCTMW